MAEKDFVRKNAATGFTIVELLIAIGLFSVVISLAMGGFARALRIQRQAGGLLLANSNASLVLEQMAREMRLGYEFCRGGGVPSCVQNDLHGSITFVKKKFPDGTNIAATYCWSADARGNGVIRRREYVVGVQPLSCDTFEQFTAKNVNVQYLSFSVSGNNAGDGYMPRVTIAMGISSVEPGVSQSPVRLQTTVSSRNPDDSINEGI